MQYIKREVYLGTNFDLGVSLSCESSFNFLLFKIGFEIKGYLAKIKMLLLIMFIIFYLKFKEELTKWLLNLWKFICI